MTTDKFYSKISLTPKQDRPRELLFEHGPEYLSDQQLIAVILGSGSKGHDVMSLSKKVLDKYQNNPIDYVKPEEFFEIEGMGYAKAALLSASFEFARRRIDKSTTKINSPADAVPLLFNYASSKKEHFLTISLNGAHQVLSIRVVSIGTINRTLVHPREVFSEVIAESAAAIICAHNHPSGNTTPSKDDIELTERIKESGQILGIDVLDHIIISSCNYFSFKENELL